jgi:hypothetical protein
MFKIALAAVIFGSSFAAGYAMRPVVSPPGATVPSPAATCWSPDMSRLPGIAEQGCGAPDVPAGEPFPAPAPGQPPPQMDRRVRLLRASAPHHV